MKMFKIIACSAIIVAALAYAGAPPIQVGGLWFNAPKYPSTTYTNINGWIIFRGSGDSLKETIQLASKDLTGAVPPKPAGQSIVIQCAKAFKGSRKDLIPYGGFSNIVYGAFTNDANVGDLGALIANDPTAQLDSKFKPGKSFALSLKGITVGTVIAKRCAPKVDSISHALLTEIKATKGVTITASGKAPYGILGTAVQGAPGTLGIAPALPAILAAQFPSNQTALAKATAKNQIADLMIFSESIPAINGSPKASLSTKAPMLNVNTLTPGPGTNSSYKAKYFYLWTLSKP